MLHGGGGGVLCLAMCAALLAPGAGALAEDTKQDPEGPFTSPVIAAECDLTEYKFETQTFSPAAVISDAVANVPSSVTFGPVVVPSDGMFIEDVVLELDCSHTWSGDLIVRLDYDENTDGVIDVSTIVICRPGRTGNCGPSGTGVGCTSNFVTGFIYRFDDTATGTLPTTGCSGNIPAGCYRPTGIGAGLLSAFEGRTKGGRWWLVVSDNQSGDSGTLTSWTVHLKNTPVSTTPTSWGQLKAIYR